ncbi:MAG: SDR family oxidoreductase [Acidimicrobiales bacterium]|nr:SDR family oxidoreductase [Acidimicrobiales bacterium]
MTAILDRLFGAEGKHVVVTGGSRGIGRMIATGFVESGATVYITARKAEACDETAAELNGLDASGSCVSIPADLSSREGIDAFARALGEHTSELHVLVNNAGATWGAPIDEYPEDGWDKVMDINVRSVFFLTQALLPPLRAASSDDDPARVINVASIDGIRTPAMESFAYGASKAAVLHLTRHLAKRLISDGITVNAIAPGPFESKMMNFMLGNEEGRRAVASGVPAKRIGQPDDLAAAALYLAGRGANYVVGETVIVDGGVANLA